MGDMNAIYLESISAYLRDIARSLDNISQEFKKQNMMHMFSYPVMVDPKTGEIVK
jgi:hypothetical protein